MSEARLCELPGGQLRTGDIIVTRSKSLNSALIRATTCAPVSHALLMVSPILAFEAMPSGGVLERTLTDIHSKARLDGEGVLVLRHRSLNFKQAQKAASFALGQKGKGYDMLGAKRSAIVTGCKAARVSPLLIKVMIVDELGKLTDQKHDKTFYCSELVARAFEFAGAPLSKYRARNISPGAILKAEALFVVGQLA